MKTSTSPNSNVKDADDDNRDEFLFDCDSVLPLFLSLS